MRRSSGPVWCGEKPDAVLADFDLFGDVAAEQLDADRQLLFGAQGNIVAGEDAGGSNDRIQGVDDGITKGLEAGAHELHHQPAVVPVADERRAGVGLAVDQAVCACDRRQWSAPFHRGTNPLAPPGIVELSAWVPVHHAKGDLGRRAPECDADRLSALILDPYGPGRCSRSFEDVAAIDPGVAELPASCAFGGHDREIVHMKGVWVGGAGSGWCSRRRGERERERERAHAAVICSSVRAVTCEA